MAGCVVERNIFDSPAVALLCQLETAGAVIEMVGDRLRIGPVEQLTPEQVASIRKHRGDLKMLVRICDDGVQDRRVAFRTALDSGVRPDTLVLRPGVPYVAGVCFSCGDRLERGGFGKCWRCALAWRLALRSPIAPELAAVYDGQRRVA